MSWKRISLNVVLTLAKRFLYSGSEMEGNRGLGCGAIVVVVVDVVVVDVVVVVAAGAWETIMTGARTVVVVVGTTPATTRGTSGCVSHE